MDEHGRHDEKWGKQCGGPPTNTPDYGQRNMPGPLHQLQRLIILAARADKSENGTDIARR